TLQLDTVSLSATARANARYLTFEHGGVSAEQHRGQYGPVMRQGQLRWYSLRPVSNTPDSDRDGVANTADTCPATMNGAIVNTEGCSKEQVDTDADGIADYLDAFPNDANESLDSDGDRLGNNADPDRDGDGVANADDVFPDDYTEWADLDQDGIGNNADPDRDGDGVADTDDYFPDDPNAHTVPTVTITAPQNLTTVGTSPVTISGTVNDTNATLTINGAPINANGQTFTATVSLEEGTNTIIARAVNARGHQGTASVIVALDTTPPTVMTDMPAQGQTVTKETIDAAGRINDLTRGTLSQEDVTVTIKSTRGEVTAKTDNRRWLAKGIQLSPGQNTLTITAADAAGNITRQTHTVTYQPPQQSGTRTEITSGQAQSAPVRQALPQPLVVKLYRDGQPASGETVVFRVMQGDGSLSVTAPGVDVGTGTSTSQNPDSQSGTDSGSATSGTSTTTTPTRPTPAIVVVTDNTGTAKAYYTLGGRAGQGSHQVRAATVGFDAPAIFYATATSARASFMGIVDGANQRGIVRQMLPHPFVVSVYDSHGNLAEGATVRFEVTQGSGRFASNGEANTTTTTDADGRARAHLITGPETGMDRQRVTAHLTNTA
ncbi:MAG: thrombospondin type 3 repeat-containing protein, partial [Proteobacteria bacterium]|nr:thrombospondin type 3 repeat-containing protein [Pseudomonadota bacterium]